MRSYFAFVVVIPSLVNAAITTDEPILPRSVIFKGTGSIVDPDSWTPIPTSAPVVTFQPTAFPSITTEAPTEADYNLRMKGGRKQCLGETVVPKNQCLEAATIAGDGDDYSFPYYLNEVTDKEMPCDCYLWWNDNGSILATYNNEPLCSKNGDTRPICKSCGSAAEKQADYRGDVSVTEGGITCQAWSSQFPHTHDITTENYPGKGISGGNDNKCRNPNNQAKAWCYTTDPGTVWDYCDVPYCPP